MKNSVCFSLPGNESLTKQLATEMNAVFGKAIIRKFPDGESYVRILSDVKDKYVVLICTLNEPNEKIIPLYFLSQTSKLLGAKRVCLVAPYLAYMRQDKMFNPGEGVTSTYFGEFISKFVDGIITVDPHLHRLKSLSEVYKIPNMAVHSTNEISKWIKMHIKNPVLIGPDSESKQWILEVAKKAEAPYLILKKTRHNDYDVNISNPELTDFKNATPVLVDDIISTAHTMIKTIEHLKKEEMKSAVCIGIHAVFSGNAYQELVDCGVDKIVTCNTIPHPTNAIDLNDILAKETKKLISHL
jgi:ribose-phosphate pyrophosphokinase